MVLPSQTTRSDNRRSNMFRRTRGKRVPFIVAGVLLIAIVAWFAWPGGDPNHADAANSNGADAPTPAGGGMELGLTGNSAGPSGNSDRRAEPPAPVPPDNGSADSGDTDSDTIATLPAAPGGAEANDQSASNLAVTGAETQKPEAPDSRLTAPANIGEPGAEEIQRARQIMRYAFELESQGRVLEARTYFTQALESGALTPDDFHKLQIAVDAINEKLVFGKVVLADDPFTRNYTVKSGESLEKIVRSHGLQVDWRFILRINGMNDPRKLRAGQTIKLVTGPFHAVVHKSKYRLDLFMGESEERVYVRSFRVGLGEYDSTPIGMFKIGSRLEDPEWINPRTRERFLPSDPMNPIGEHWLALDGIDENTRDFTGYGIHGTIEPQSIGKQQSMGCIRMLPEDVAIVYEALLSETSLVEIRP